MASPNSQLSLSSEKYQSFPKQRLFSTCHFSSYLSNVISQLMHHSTTMYIIHIHHGESEFPTFIVIREISKLSQAAAIFYLSLFFIFIQRHIPTHAPLYNNVHNSYPPWRVRIPNFHCHPRNIKAFPSSGYFLPVTFLHIYPTSYPNSCTTLQQCT